MNLKAIIVDDERLARRELRALLADFDEISVIGEAENLSETVALIEQENPDVVFLDIQLSGENGFDLLEKIEKKFELIFVTAYDEFAIRAFEINALDYLLKPVNPERLLKAVERLLRGEKTSRPMIRPLDYDDRLFLDSGEKSCFLLISDISHICASGDYTEIFSSSGHKFLLEKPLREWETRLPEKHFMRIHRSTIINLNEIEKIETWFNRTLQIRLRRFSNEFTVSRRYAAKLKNRFA